MKTSVALCTYNGEKYIEEQLNSILNQTVPVDEIVICDDKSTDATHDIINQYCNKFPGVIKFYINEVNLRSVKNFEKAISLCTNEIIFLSDQDDIWHLEKVKHFIEYFKNNPKIDVVASNGYCIDDNSKVHEKYAVWDVPQFLAEKGVAFNYHKIICYVSNIATGASMAFRKTICDEILPFPIMKDFHHDEWIAILSSKRDAFVMLPEKYFYYRIHENQQVGVNISTNAFLEYKYNTFYHAKNLHDVNQLYKKSLATLKDIKDKTPSLMTAELHLKNWYSEQVKIHIQNFGLIKRWALKLKWMYK